MPGMIPALKMTKMEENNQVAKFSLSMKRGDNVLEASFPLRRKLITCNRGRKTTTMMQEIFPTMFTAWAVSCRYCSWLKATFKKVITK